MDMRMCSILTSIYLIPGYFLYLLFTIQLFKKKDREFKNPFFQLIKLLAIVDLIFIPLHYYSYRLGSFEFLYPLFKNFEQKNIAMTLVVYFYCVFQHAQFLCHFLISFNRLSAVTMLHSYNKFWSPKRFWIFRVFVIAFPMIYMGWLLYFGGNMSYADTYLYSVDSFKTGSNWVKKSTFCIIVGVSTGIVAFGMDLTTFIIICTKHMVDSKQHFRLLAISAVVLLTHLVYMFFEVFYIFPQVTIMDEMTYFKALIVMLDIQSLISPFCNIALNPYLRKSLFQKHQPHFTIVPSISFVKP